MVAVPAKTVVVKTGHFVRAKSGAEIRRALKLKPANKYKIHKLLAAAAS